MSNQAVAVIVIKNKIKRLDEHKSNRLAQYA
jgi:hypothetical protein